MKTNYVIVVSAFALLKYTEYYYLPDLFNGFIMFNIVERDVAQLVKPFARRSRNWVQS